MVALGAECWKKAAQIYLLCRLFRYLGFQSDHYEKNPSLALFIRNCMTSNNIDYRYPRTHPVVMAKLDLLTQCLSRMPCSGSLFTSMTPLFPCFLLGILSVETRHRNIVLHWFNTVMGANQCRSVSVLSVRQQIKLGMRPFGNIGINSNDSAFHQHGGH